MDVVLKMIGLVVFAVIGVILITMFFSFIVIAAGAFIGIFLAAWALGIPITVKVDGQKIGYYRWGTFHPTR